MEIFKKEKSIEFLIALLFILTAVILRILPHAPNFTPVAAIALFGAVYFSKKIAIVLPLAAMFISDIFIGFYDIKLMAVVYSCFLLCVIVGFWLKRNKKWYTILGSSCLAAFIFFLLTNFAVWAFAPWYAKSFSGLIQCYLMALPFFRSTLSGNLFYVVISFGSFELTRIWVSKKFGLNKQPRQNLTSLLNNE